MNRKSFQRPKINCLCRCTPRGGIKLLTTNHVYGTLRQTIARIRSSRSTGLIAALSLRVGEMFEQTGHHLLAITIYRTAINSILSIDSSRAYDYDEYGPRPGNPYHRYWNERTNDADALEVANRLDVLYQQLGLKQEAHQQRRIQHFYNSLFEDIYGEWMP